MDPLTLAGNAGSVFGGKHSGLQFRIIVNSGKRNLMKGTFSHPLIRCEDQGERTIEQGKTRSVNRHLILTLYSRIERDPIGYWKQMLKYHGWVRFDLTISKSEELILFSSLCMGSVCAGFFFILNPVIWVLCSSKHFSHYFCGKPDGWPSALLVPFQKNIT